MIPALTEFTLHFSTTGHLNCFHSFVLLYLAYINHHAMKTFKKRFFFFNLYFGLLEGQPHPHPPPQQTDLIKE